LWYLKCSAVPEWFAAAAFGLVTIFTLLLRNVPVLQENLLYEVSLSFIDHSPSFYDVLDFFCFTEEIKAIT
jgi:hypothetical protein